MKTKFVATQHPIIISINARIHTKHQNNNNRKLTQSRSRSEQERSNENEKKKSQFKWRMTSDERTSAHTLIASTSISSFHRQFFSSSSSSKQNPLYTIKVSIQKDDWLIKHNEWHRNTYIEKHVIIQRSRKKNPVQEPLTNAHQRLSIFRNAFDIFNEQIDRQTSNCRMSKWRRGIERIAHSA